MLASGEVGAFEVRRLRGLTWCGDERRTILGKGK